MLRTTKTSISTTVPNDTRILFNPRHTVHNSSYVGVFELRGNLMEYGVGEYGSFFDQHFNTKENLLRLKNFVASTDNVNYNDNSMNNEATQKDHEHLDTTYNFQDDMQTKYERIDHDVDWHFPKRRNSMSSTQPSQAVDLLGLLSKPPHNNKQQQSADNMNTQPQTNGFGSIEDIFSEESVNTGHVASTIFDTEDDMELQVQSESTITKSVGEYEASVASTEPSNRTLAMHTTTNTATVEQQTPAVATTTLPFGENKTQQEGTSMKGAQIESKQADVNISNDQTVDTATVTNEVQTSTNVEQQDKNDAKAEVNNTDQNATHRKNEDSVSDKEAPKQEDVAVDTAQKKGDAETNNNVQEVMVIDNAEIITIDTVDETSKVQHVEETQNKTVDTTATAVLLSANDNANDGDVVIVDAPVPRKPNELQKTTGHIVDNTTASPLKRKLDIVEKEENEFVEPPPKKQKIQNKHEETEHEKTQTSWVGNMIQSIITGHGALNRVNYDKDETERALIESFKWKTPIFTTLNFCRVSNISSMIIDGIADSLECMLKKARDAKQKKVAPKKKTAIPKKKGAK